MLSGSCAAAIAAPDDIKCSGVVVDEQGEPIIGATVTLPGTSTATATDVDGHFTLLVPQGKKLNITYIGYKPVEVVAKPDMGTIPMEVEAQMLKDVVITQSAARTASYSCGSVDSWSTDYRCQAR